MAKKEPSWWRLRQIRHRDAVILAILSASCLLGGQITDNATQCASPPCSISGIYEDYVAPYLNNPPVLVVLLGIVSHTLMGKYALMLKKHAKRVLRRWRKSRRPADRSSKPRVT